MDKYRNLPDAYQVFCSVNVPFDEQEHKRTSPYNFMLKTASLSEEGQFIVHLIINSPQELTSFTLDAVRNYLRDIKKWKWVRIQAAFREVRHLLQ